VERGAGLAQPGMAAAEARLAAGDWLHVFPEGTRSRDGRMAGVRRGVGRLVAACDRPPLGVSGAPACPVVCRICMCRIAVVGRLVAAYDRPPLGVYGALANAYKCSCVPAGVPALPCMPSAPQAVPPALLLCQRCL
jgi:hypothetical protein